MDADRFDRLARALTLRPGRRSLVGAAVGAALAATRAPEAAAACKSAGKVCSPRKPEACCSKKCDAKTKTCRCTPSNCPTPDNPCETEACVDGRCGAKIRRNGAACPVGVCEDGGCCKPEGGDCKAAGFAVCCSKSCDSLVGGSTCSPCEGHFCTSAADCCGGLPCENVEADGRCGGCRDRSVTCSTNSQCCFSDCYRGVCHSNAGGRCRRDVDCAACYFNGRCDGACFDGRCHYEV